MNLESFWEDAKAFFSERWYFLPLFPQMQNASRCTKWRHSPSLTAGMENCSLIPMGDQAHDFKGTPVELAKPYFPPATSTNLRDKIIPAWPPLRYAPLTLLYHAPYVGTQVFTPAQPSSPSHTRWGAEPVTLPSLSLQPVSVFYTI